MSEFRCYTGRIGDLNKGKEEFLKSTLLSLDTISAFIFTQKDKWWDQQFLYHRCRELSPEVPSKILQNFISLYNPKRLKKEPKKPIKSGIYLDQNFDLKITESVLTPYWLRLSKLNFPIHASHFKDKVNPEDIKMIHIYKEKGNYYARFTCSKNIACSKNMNTDGTMNKKRKWSKPSSFSNQIKNNTSLAGKVLTNYVKALPSKDVKKKNNFTDTFLHQATNEIVKDFRKKEVEVLLLENRESLISMSFNKMSILRGKEFRRLLSNFPYKKFTALLKYKCLDSGLEVYPSKQAYTDRMKSGEKSLNGRRKHSQVLDTTSLIN